MTIRHQVRRQRDLNLGPARQRERAGVATRLGERRPHMAQTAAHVRHEQAVQPPPDDLVAAQADQLAGLLVRLRAAASVVHDQDRLRHRHRGRGAAIVDEGQVSHGSQCEPG